MYNKLRKYIVIDCLIGETMSDRRIIQVNEKVPLRMGIPLSIQHTFAMFSASVLVPYILGIFS